MHFEGIFLVTELKPRVFRTFIFNKIEKFEYWLLFTFYHGKIPLHNFWCFQIIFSLFLSLFLTEKFRFRRFFLSSTQKKRTFHQMTEASVCDNGMFEIEPSSVIFFFTQLRNHFCTFHFLLLLVPVYNYNPLHAVLLKDTSILPFGVIPFCNCYPLHVGAFKSYMPTDYRL